jgi:hypothetical protein
VNSRRFGLLHLGFGIVVLLALVACGAASASTMLPLRADAQTSAPEVRVLAADAGGVRLAFELPALEIENFDLNGEVYQSAWFSESELIGAVGEPALPEFTRFITFRTRTGSRTPAWRAIPPNPASRACRSCSG